GGVKVTGKLDSDGYAHRDVAFILRRSTEDDLWRRRCRYRYGRRFFARNHRRGRRFGQLNPFSRDIEPLQASAFVHDPRHFEPARRVDPGIECEIEPLALGAGATHPDRCVSRSDDEIPAAPRGRVRQVAEQVSSAELACHGDLLIEIARWAEHDGTNRRRW